MRNEKRSRWYLWSCDLDGCNAMTTTHPAIDDDPEAIPLGWLVIAPPKFWKGPSLAFCSTDHRNQWAQATVGPLLLGDGRA